MKQVRLTFLYAVIISMITTNVFAQNVTFADDNVKAICVANWDSNSDGELSEEEAAAVTSIGTVFQNNTEISSFSEFKYFTGVTAIDQYALSGCTNLATIEFPSSLTTIDRYALYNSGFKNLVFPDNVTSIGNSAVRNCTSLESVKIGRNSVVFGKNVFRDCIGLTSITFDGTKCYFSGEDAFRDCNALKQVVITDVSAWCKSSFSYTRSNPLSFAKSLLLQTSDGNISAIRHLVIPDDITTVGIYAFYELESLESVVIPSSVIFIGSSAFWGCSNLSAVTVEATEPIAITSFTFSNRANATLYVPAGCKAAYEAADYWKEFMEIIEMPSQLQDGDTFSAKTLEDIDMTFKVISNTERTCMVGNGSSAAISTSYEGNVTIPSVVYGYRVISIGYRSFRRTNITSVVIPSSIDAIGTEAFEQCYKLTSAIIPDGVTEIYDEAFKKCTGLESVEIAGSVRTIYSEVFKNCSQLRTVILKDGFTKTGSSMFEGCSNLVTVDIPNSIESIGWGTFSGCSSITTISLPQTVTYIGSSAFANCTALTSFTIPSAIDKIEDSSFSGCTSLTSIVIPENVHSIRAAAFSICTNLASIVFPSTINYIGSGAFDGTRWYNDKEDGIVYVGKIAYKYKGEMPERSAITIDEGTISVSPGAFSNISNLVEISLPQSITSIGEWCFSGCSNMEKVKVGMAEPVIISSSTFTNVENMYLYVPEGCVDLYLKADVWKDFLCIKQISDPEMFSGGDGTADSPYIINTIGDFKVLARDVNNGNSYSGTYFKVGKAEIDFSGITYTAIGRGEYDTNGNEVVIGFSGNFDGNGVSIMNLSTDKALFGYIGKNGLVANVTIDESCKINGYTSNVAGIAGSNKGTIDNCVNFAAVSCTKYHVAGICGDNMGTISNCKNYGAITCESENGMTGGIAGDLDAGNILNCENYGNVVSDGFWIGGIVGLITGQNSSVKNCQNQGDVTGPYDVGGIFGSNSYPSTIICDNMVSGCTINSTRDSGSSSFGAGVIGWSIGSSICSNNFYTPDVVLIVGSQTYDGSTPRGVWSYDSTNNTYGPADVTENCAAMILQKGDVNCNGIVNALDVQEIINAAVVESAESKYDINGDGKINALDIQEVINIAAATEARRFELKDD